LIETASEIFVFLAGISYLAVGAYLLQKASATRGLAEFYLGVAFLFNGLSFGFSEILFIINTSILLNEFSYIARIWSAACSVTIAIFTWKVFRSNAKWARRLVCFDVALLSIGLAVSAWEGDWEGYYPLAYKGFWIEWLGGIAPFIWLSVESLRQYVLARRRVLLGLSDPIICNRYLLIGLYATLAASTYFICIRMYIIHELYGKWSVAMDLALGFVETVSVIALSISFSAPAFYRRWIGGAPGETSQAQ
jgi:hypothetical protein